MTPANHNKIVGTFDKPDLQRLIKRLCDRRDRAQPLTGALVLDQATIDERRAIDELLGRAPTVGERLSIPLDTLLTRMQNARLADNWDTVLTALCGPPDQRRKNAANRELAWQQLWKETYKKLPAEKLFLNDWLKQLKQDGLLKRLSEGDEQSARKFILQALSILHELPANSESLAGLAARITGNSHALDTGTPLATLVLRAISASHSIPMPRSAADFRTHWALAGVVCDELSAPVLTLNLRMPGSGALGNILSIAADSGLPLHLNTMILLNTNWISCQTPKRVFICENPVIVNIAARKHGNKTAPLICTDGEPKTAFWHLTHQLRNKGTEFYYHGDFDKKGLAIAGRIFEKLNAIPWRFNTIDYLAGPIGEKLTEIPKPATWDSQLTETMQNKGYIIHEEAVADSLLNDLVSHYFCK